MALELEVGSEVTCGICKKATTVSLITDREGTLAYDLKCWHRNAICSKCGDLVRDASEVVQRVEPHCVNCDGPLDDDDDE